MAAAAESLMLGTNLSATLPLASVVSAADLLPPRKPCEVVSAVTGTPDLAMFWATPLTIFTICPETSMESPMPL